MDAATGSAVGLGITGKVRSLSFSHRLYKPQLKDHLGSKYVNCSN